MIFAAISMEYEGQEPERLGKEVQFRQNGFTDFGPYKLYTRGRWQKPGVPPPFIAAVGTLRPCPLQYSPSNPSSTFSPLTLPTNIYLNSHNKLQG